MLARLIPIGYHNRALAAKHEIILDYVDGYVFFKDANEDVLPIKTAGYDRAYKTLEESGKLFNTGITGGSLGALYGGVNPTYNSKYVAYKPVVDANTSISYFDTNVDNATYGLLAQLTKQGLNSYVRDGNYINMLPTGNMVIDQKYNDANGLPSNTPSLSMPITNSSYVLCFDYVPGTGIVYEKLSTKLFNMNEEIDTKLDATEILKYLPKGAGWVAGDTTLYPDLKAVITAIGNRYTKTETETNFAPKGNSTANIATFNTDGKYNGLRYMKDIVDYMLATSKSLGDNYLPLGLTPDDITKYKSMVPYTSYGSMKAIIDAMIPKGSGWNSAIAPFNTYTTMESILTRVLNTYTKTESDSTFIAKADGLSKGSTPARITTFNNTPKYNVYTDMISVIDAITDRYTKAEIDNKVLPRAANPTLTAEFDSGVKYNGYRTGKDMADALIDTYRKNETIPVGATLPEGYTDAKKLVDKIVYLENKLLAANNPIVLEPIGNGYGEVYDVFDREPYFVRDTDVNLPSLGVISTAQRAFKKDLPMVGFKQHYGDVMFIHQGVSVIAYPSTIDIDTGMPNGIYMAAHSFHVRSRWSVTNDIFYYGGMSHYQEHDDNVDLNTGNNECIITPMTNRCSKYIYFLTALNAEGSATTRMQRHMSGSGDNVVVMEGSTTDIYKDDIYSSGESRKNQVCRVTDFGITEVGDDTFIQAIKTKSKIVYYLMYKNANSVEDKSSCVFVDGSFTMSPHSNASKNVLVKDTTGLPYANRKVTLSFTGSTTTNAVLTTNASGICTATITSGSSTINIDNSDIVFTLDNPTVLGTPRVIISATSRPVNETTFIERNLKYVESIFSNDKKAVVTCSVIDEAGTNFNGLHVDAITYTDGTKDSSFGKKTFADMFANAQCGLGVTDRDKCKLLYVDTHGDEIRPNEIVDLYFYHKVNKRIYKQTINFEANVSSGLTLSEPRYADTGSMIPINMNIGANSVAITLYACSLKFNGVYLPGVLPTISCSIPNVTVEAIALGAGTSRTNATEGVINLRISNYKLEGVDLSSILDGCVATHPSYKPGISLVEISNTGEIVGATQNDYTFLESGDYHLEKHINGNVYNIPDNLVNPYALDAMKKCHKVYRISKKL